jgi:2-polyprenyl-3-methyl-5-hydroxy-6-metoxy-1,4-benzoquinol methylase
MKNQIYWFKKKIQWNIKYFQGKWNFMEYEDVRYQTIQEMISKSNLSNASILDLGCGFGTLCKHLKNDYKRYLGVDLSSNVINKAKKRKYPNSEFISKNIQEYIPNEKHDVIIFNEVIYYLDNPVNELIRYANYLSKEGFIIISIYGIREDLIEKFKKILYLENQIIASKETDLFWGISKFTKKQS